MYELPEIPVKRKTGEERFTLDNKNSSFNLRDFWSWSQSNLIENRTRGILAEFIVKKSLGIQGGVRVEWDTYDLKTSKGIRVEVKSASYLQSWKQKKYSNIQFGISKTKGEPINPEYDGKFRRWSDYYIFCLLTVKDQEKIDPLDLHQWTFYVLKTEIINRKLGEQKSIGLNSLLKLEPSICKFGDLKNLINE